jgi:LPXTG-motif cell wall-anchored protein
MRHPRIGRPAVVIGAAFVLATAAAAPAWATDPLPLHQASTTAAGFGTHECSQTAATAGKDGWVFVLPGNKGEFTSLTLTFTFTGGTATLHVPGDGSIINNQGASKAVVQTPAGWTLTGGSATISGSAPVNFFNLSHTCPSPSNGGGGGGGDSSNGGGGGGGSATGGGSSNGGGTPRVGSSLPITGGSVAGLLALGGVLVAAGGTLLVLRRRRPVRFRP